MTSRRSVLTPLLALGLLLGAAACGDDDESGGGSGSGDGPAITVGAKLDPEAQLLGHLMAKTLEAEGYDVETKIPTGNTDITRKALESGEIDIYWEFTSTGLSILEEPPIGDPEEAYQKAKELDAKNGITWLPSASMNDTYALAVADDGPVEAETLSELAEEGAEDLTLCVDPEGGFRADVLPVVEETYGLTFPKTTQVDADLIAQAVRDDQCQVGIVYSTSFLIPKNDLRVLEDDEQAFGAYTPAPTLKTERLEDYPDLEEDLAELTESLDTDTITELNAQADGDPAKTEQVAEDFLVEQGIVDG